MEEEYKKPAGRWVKRLLVVLVLVLAYWGLWRLTSSRGPQEVLGQLEAQRAASAGAEPAAPAQAKPERLPIEPQALPYDKRPERWWFLGNARSPFPFVVTVDESSGGQVSASGTQHYALWLFGYTRPLWDSPRWTDRNEGQLARAKELSRPGVTVATLVAALKDPNKNIRAQAAWGLYNKGAEAAEAVPDLIRAFESDPDTEVRTRAAQALGSIGRAAAPAVPSLLAILKDKDLVALHGQAAFALGAIGSAAGEAVPTLIEAMQSGEKEVRLQAIQALGKMGAPAKTAIPALDQARKNDPSEEVRAQATRSMNILQTR